MVSKNLVICDSEEGYAQALAMYFMRKKELAAEVQVCSTVTQVMELEKRRRFIFVFVGRVCKGGERKTSGGENILADDRNGRGRWRKSVYKYQSGEKIVEDMIRICGLEASENESIYKGGRKQEEKSSVFFAGSSDRKDDLRAETGRRDGSHRKCPVSESGNLRRNRGHFEEGEQTLADVLYYARQEKGNLGLLLTTVVKHRKNLDYIVPMPVAEDVKV